MSTKVLPLNRPTHYPAALVPGSETDIEMPGSEPLRDELEALSQAPVKPSPAKNYRQFLKRAREFLPQNNFVRQLNNSGMTQLAFRLNAKIPLLKKLKNFSLPTRLAGLATLIGSFFVSGGSESFIKTLFDWKSNLMFLGAMALNLVGHSMNPQNDKNTFDGIRKIIF